MFDVIIQGPPNKYIVDIINSYRHPRISKIIYSCWKDDILPEDLPGDIDLVINTKPLYCGPHNTNYQLYSSRAGIERANTEYVLKVRSDFFLDREILNNIEDYAKKYNRIITCGVSITLCFSTWDYLYFGKKEQLKTMFTAPSYNEYIPWTTPREYWSKAIMAETYLTAYYIANFNSKVKYLWDNKEKYLVLHGEGYEEAKILTAEILPQYFRPLPGKVKVWWTKHYNEYITLEKFSTRNYHGTVFTNSW